jgi:two-component system, sensor histidine kinase and response regulator
LSNYSDSACQQVEEALRKQVAQERLLNRVTSQIRNSFDLSVIMKTAIAQVREFLELDRLVVYKFEEHKFAESQVKSQENLINSANNFSITNNAFTLRSSQILEAPQQYFVEYSGCIIYEVCKNDKLSQLFEKFHQLYTPYNRRYEKTGLGLALTKATCGYASR